MLNRGEQCSAATGTAAAGCKERSVCAPLNPSKLLPKRGRSWKLKGDNPMHLLPFVAPIKPQMRWSGEKLPPNSNVLQPPWTSCGCTRALLPVDRCAGGSRWWCSMYEYRDFKKLGLVGFAIDNRRRTIKRLERRFQRFNVATLVVLMPDVTTPRHWVCVTGMRLCAILILSTHYVAVTETPTTCRNLLFAHDRRLHTTMTLRGFWLLPATVRIIIIKNW